MAKRRLQSPEVLLNMDSLVDIVSNNVGILIILAVFMALFSLVNPMPEQDSETAPALEMPPVKLRIPWSHATTKNTIYLIVRGNRILPIDLRSFYNELAQRPAPQRLVPLEVPLRDLTVKFFPVTNQVYCLEFFPDKGAGETWLQAQNPSSLWRTVRERYPAEKFVYFFWVSGDSFELFREMRDRLWDAQVEVGWKPALRDESVSLCNGFDGSTTFQPQ